MFRNFPSKKRRLYPTKKRDPEATLRAAVSIAEVSKNSIARAESRKIKYDSDILAFEKERWKIIEILQKQEEKLRLGVKMVQTLEIVRKSMLVAIRKESELKSISERLIYLLTKLNKSIIKLETEISILGKMNFPSQEMEQTSDKIVTELCSIINRAGEITEGLKFTANENEALREKYISLATKAKDITETYY